MQSSKFELYQIKYICSLVYCKPAELEYILNHIDDYYKEWFEEKKNKETGITKAYKDGTPKSRVIRPSLRKVKAIQERIKTKILASISMPYNVHGGVKKRNNITNAKAHQGNKYQFTTDLQDFFPSISSRQINNAFMLVGFSNHAASLLTKLCTWKHELPQGTPTSTHIANIVFLETDKKLIGFCKANGITYTRFVDDLTFSSQKDFKHLLNPILDIVINDGFKIGYRKTQYKGNQTITGIEVHNNYIDAPVKIKTKAKSEANSSNKPYSNYLNQIRKTNTGVEKRIKKQK